MDRTTRSKIISTASSRTFNLARISLIGFVCAILFPTTASAVIFDIGNDFEIQLDSRITSGVAWRMEDPDDDLIGIANGGTAFSTNGDEAQAAYNESGRIAFSVLKITSDLTFSWQDFGVFVRGTYRYDPVNDDKPFFDEDDHGGAASFDSQNRRNLSRKRDAIQDEIGNNNQLLDAFLFGSVELFDRDLSFRIGRQTLNWGEATLIPNGINSVDAANLNNLRVPGFELAEVFTPAAMTWVSVELIENLNAEIFYQWEWEKTEIDATGSYFSNNDFVGIGGNNAEIGFGRCPENSVPGTCAFAAGGSAIPRGDDIEPDDGGQYGAAIRYYAEWLYETEMALYFANYHSRLPVVSGNAVIFPGVPGSGQYTVEYPEDIQIYGMSFNTNIPWGIALQGEYSYKKDQPLAIDEVELFLAGLRVGQPSQIGMFGPGEFIQGWEAFDVSQFNISGTKILGPSRDFGYDQALILVETAVSYIHDKPSNNVLRLEGPATYLPANPGVAAASGVPTQRGGYADATSWGYRTLLRYEYNSVLGKFNLQPTVIFAHDVSGTSASPILNFIEDRKQLTLAVTGNYQQSWDAGIAFSRYWGGEPFNLNSDRDLATVFLGYSF